MKALEVFISGHRLCLAGVGDNGVLNAIVSWVGSPGRGDDDIFLSVGGLDSVSREHRRWNVPSIGVGSEILVRVVEATSVDPPDKRIRAKRRTTKKRTTLEEYRESLRELSEELTEDERRQLLRELIAELESKDT